MAKIDLTAERVRELLKYDAETGLFQRKLKTTGVYIACGGVDSISGYVRAWLDNRQYSLHRVAWLYVTGQWPEFYIDHIDGDKTNNRFSNLRDVPHSVNAQNLTRFAKKTKSGLLGVNIVRGALGDKWTAHISTNRALIHLGTFASPEDAQAAYIQAKRERHAGCTI